jgi:uncharacterized membrane protein
MSQLIVLGFDTEAKAREAAADLAEMQRERLIEMEDAVVVVRHQDGKVEVKQLGPHMAVLGAASGGFWGMLIGLLFLSPLFGFLVGAASGAIAGALSDVGVDDEFIKELGRKLTPGTSSLFLLVGQATTDKVVADLQKYDARVLRTSLSATDEARLQEALRTKAV